MTASTSRLHIDPTLSIAHGNRRWNNVRQKIWKEWSERGEPDMVATLREHPDLLSQKSLLMELAIDEYEARREDSPAADLSTYCHRFREFGSEICNSIHHALEVQQHFVGDVTWPNMGDEWDGFQFVEQLGRGASARVYLCRETALGYRQVVVKLSPHTSFEAAILGRLEHPNITPLFSAGTIADGSLNYLCMPFLGRSTLNDLVELAFRDGCPRNGTAIEEAANRWAGSDSSASMLSLRRSWMASLDSYVDGVLCIGIQIAAALARAHEKCILHGDLKPSNVLLTPDGQPVLLDFNLSHDFDEGERTYGGTIPYMPPEHLRILAERRDETHGGDFTAASDIYSFGALLYELLSGTTPVANLNLCDEPSLAAQRALDQLTRGVPEVRSRNPLVGRGLSAFVSKCMSFDPADRPATMQEVTAALQAERRSFAAAVRRARVRPLLFSLLVGVPILAATGGVGYLASRPASHIRNYDLGLQLVEQSRPSEAANYFTTALNAKPTFWRARFELARARLASGEIDLAINDFHMLDRDESHLQSAAYLAYCFNCKSSPTAAIPPYERAIRGGYATLAVYNNLAASYIDGSNVMTPLERLQAAQSALGKAYELNRSSPTVSLNYVRLATRMSQYDVEFDPITSWQFAAPLLKRMDADWYVRWQLALYWKQITDRHSHKSRNKNQISQPETALPSLEESVRQKLMAGLDGFPGPPNVISTRGGTPDEGSHVRACYIEPR